MYAVRTSDFVRNALFIGRNVMHVNLRDLKRYTLLKGPHYLFWRRAPEIFQLCLTHGDRFRLYRGNDIIRQHGLIAFVVNTVSCENQLADREISFLICPSTLIPL